ncbi:hypothetical protein [Acinetobacter silvestris]|uniref:Uncharacterized protein n=1 Tax=Acinetobacter silvestris TaxID=1977882 RepID=A0A1Y3CKZ4_9GAMM|nr:hypothetical protein [Acinetobacter silvestris]OTG67262.1 hypothetical protein B9T28_01100 [Acinetobacter silvestris]
MQPDQKIMLDILEKQRQQQRQIDRVLKIVLPITAFLLCVICANFNWQSTLGTFFVLVIAFYAVGIKQMNVYLWLAIIAAYCLIDIYLSYGTIHLSALGRQMGTMLTFTGILGFGRPYIDQWFFKSNMHK